MRWLAIALVLASGGCKNLNLPDLSAYTPKVRFDRVDLGKADWNGVDSTFVLKVDNPNPIGVKLASWTWDLDVAGMDFLSGDNSDGTDLEASGTSELAIPARLVFMDLINTAKAVKGQDEVPFAVGGELGFGTPLGVVKVPWKDEGTLPVLRKPKIKVQRLRVEGLDVLKGRANLALDLAVSHDGSAKIDLDNAAWKLGLGGTQVADGSLPSMASVSGGEASTVSLPIGVNLLQLGSTVVKALKNKTAVPVEFGADLTVGTPLGALPLKIDESATVPVQ